MVWYVLTQCYICKRLIMKLAQRKIIAPYRIDKQQHYLCQINLSGLHLTHHLPNLMVLLPKWNYKVLHLNSYKHLHKYKHVHKRFFLKKKKHRNNSLDNGVLMLHCISIDFKISNSGQKILITNIFFLPKTTHFQYQPSRHLIAQS